MLDTPCYEVVWRVLATHCIRPFPLHFPSRASPCVITFQLDSNAGYTMFRGSVKSTGYTLHSPVSPSLPLPCASVCHHISAGLYEHVCTHTASRCTNCVHGTATGRFINGIVKWMDKMQLEGHNNKFKFLFKIFTCTIVEIAWYMHNLDQLPIHTTPVIDQMKSKDWGIRMAGKKISLVEWNTARQLHFIHSLMTYALTSCSLTSCVCLHRRTVRHRQQATAFHIWKFHMTEC